ncbi:hypothetical protein FGE12_05610 [Aggregicoccus sp. 17bor-14]|uniref:hypothetical protein n=1 Tax=Myxococcaceae TaxID=31 RepID=UPI00129CA4FC|nr:MULTISPECIES: hypothetical protein [Myxococcaceae]MBF5041859.1 hypothetical protein [Simulacricoccus sp. 17bor-14]MRI87640.1 hypothetical protein [Aggregicoccus sp. 17bor-14]
MNNRLRLFAAVVVLGSSAALAQVSVDVRLPSIHFAVRPPVVTVEPGVQVVEDCDDEVYYVNEYYYVRQGPNWYRTRDHRGHWVRVEERYVPVTVVRAPPGKYRRYHHRDEREVRVIREEPRREVKTVYVRQEREPVRKVVYVEERRGDDRRDDDRDDHHDHGKHKGHGKH